MARKVHGYVDWMNNGAVPRPPKAPTDWLIRHHCDLVSALQASDSVRPGVRPCLSAADSRIAGVSAWKWGDDRLPNGSWSKVPDLLCPAPSLAPPPFICLVPHPSTSAVLHTDFPPPLSRTLCRRSPPLSSARPPPPLPPLLTSSSSSSPPSRPPAPPPQAHGAIAVGGMSLPQTAALIRHLASLLPLPPPPPPKTADGAPARAGAARPAALPGPMDGLANNGSGRGSLYKSDDVVVTAAERRQGLALSSGNGGTRGWCSEAPCPNDGTQPPCAPPPPTPLPPLPACHSHSCPDDFINSGIEGRFPGGADPCNSTTTCVEDVLPGCDCYRGDADSAWGVWCEDAIASFDRGGIVNGSHVAAHAKPKNVGGDPDTGNPIYYFGAPNPNWYVIFLPPANALPISADSGRYEYFLLQYLRSKNIGVFVLRTPDPTTDLWDHVAQNNRTSPYSYNCSRIKSGYPFCDEPCDMCTKDRSTSLIEGAIDKASALGYAEQNLILMGWSSGGSMASAFLSFAHQTGFTTARNTSYSIKVAVGKTAILLTPSLHPYWYAYERHRSAE